MPRNGSGVASQPTSTAAVSGDTISSTKFNSIMADVYSLFNTTWPLPISQNLAALGGQPLNANLTSISSLGTAADKVAYTTAAGTWAETAFPAWARTFNGSADLAAARVYFQQAPVQSLGSLSLVAGDVLYSPSANTLQRLAKGTSLQVLRMNSGATAPEWASPELGIGIGQSWQNLTASRTFNTSYQNTTTRPIMVSIRPGNPTASVAGLQVSADGTTWIMVGPVGNVELYQVTAIVPVGHYYRLLDVTVGNWSELR